jgi:transcriptional regulator with XRE-family HTH domain
VAKIKDKTHPAVLALKNYAESKKINRDDLAHKAGVGLVTINRLMSGDIPSESTLRKIETSLQIRLTAAFEALACEELGGYPKSWCDDLVGRYIVIRQNRWLGGHDIINTFPVSFEWCKLKPGLRMSWEHRIDPKMVRQQSAYVSITSRDGLLTIVGSNLGHFTSTHLQRDGGQANRLFGIYCGFGEVGRGHRSIVAQVVAYVREGEIDFRHDWQARPGSPGYGELRRFLAEIEGVYCHIVAPPRHT